jgi:hypothetical protein
MRKTRERDRSVLQGGSTDSLKFHSDSPCPTLLHPAGGPPLKWPYGQFGGGPPTGRVAWGRVLPFWTPHAVGEFLDQGDAKWIVIRRSLRGHNDMPCGRPPPGLCISCPGSGHPQGVIGVF